LRIWLEGDERDERDEDMRGTGREMYFVSFKVLDFEKSAKRISRDARENHQLNRWCELVGWMCSKCEEGNDEVLR